MAQTRDTLLKDPATSDSAASINNCYANLLRMWSDV
ncbi:MAG: hypothetical protein KDJ38_16535 [Gammaproteobacteria bacterium]|nr:hypothetical protein [Gammaproteobacteria bacterium]